jgi:hypothetical protein
MLARMNTSRPLGPALFRRYRPDDAVRRAAMIGSVYR